MAHPVLLDRPRPVDAVERELAEAAGAGQVRLVLGHELAERLERRDLQLVERAVGARADVQQHPPALRDRVDDVPHHLRTGHVLGVILDLVVAEGQAHAAAVLPRLAVGDLAGLVLGGHEVLVRAGEAVVDQPFGTGRVEVLEQLAEPALLEVEVLVGPADVVPEDVG